MLPTEHHLNNAKKLYTSAHGDEEVGKLGRTLGKLHVDNGESARVVVTGQILALDIGLQHHAAYVGVPVRRPGHGARLQIRRNGISKTC